MTVQHPHLSHPKYRPDIDGLRAIAVLAVVAFHAFPAAIKGGFIGVDVFFVISGYLISTIIFENLDRGTFSFAEFYARRIKRIFPSLIIVLVACCVFGWFTLLADEFKQLGKHIAAGAGFLSNFVLWNEAGYFDNSSETKPLLHLWSLGIEEQFYVVWPLLLWLAWKRKFNLLTVAVLVAAISFFLNVKGIKQDVTATFYSPQTRFWELLSGSLLAWFAVYKKGAYKNIVGKLDRLLGLIIYRENQDADGRTLLNVISFIGTFFLVYGFWRINKEFSFPGKWALVPVVGTLLIILAGAGAWINRTILSNKLVVWFGLISFPLYLWHWPLLSFLRMIEVEAPSRNMRIAVVALSIVLSWLTYVLVERPMRFGGHGKAKLAVLVGLMTVVGFAGYNIYIRDGLNFRPIQKQVNNLFPAESRAYELNLGASFRNYYGNPDAKKPIVLVIGDSYATNWGVALGHTVNLDAYDVVNVSYLGCSVSLESGRIVAKSTAEKHDKNCSAFGSFLNDSSVINNATALMLVSHRPFEYAANTFRFDVIKFLVNKNPKIDVFVFGNYFQLNPVDFPSCEKLMVKAKKGAEVCLKYASYPVQGKKIESEAFFPKDMNFSYIDFGQAVCPAQNATCPSSYDGVPFMTDWNHLTSAFLIHYLPDVFKKNEALKKFVR
ncbi:acyltransferase family protein [Pseudoduganella sp. FT26W]|uniref:Acyltransferase family protein n=1 Tax=Duganella aquatilis TaxID=2666082 RepID=A0A844DCH3_9BURK|nr:acyltransferase family protein [Duganella aquatilis]MRW88165.1 acyltransferase family protein [Duganella aquatilis]